MRNRRRTTAFTALAAIALLAAGCSSSSSSSGSSKNSTIRLMVDTTMTPAAALGGLSFPYSAVGAKAAAAALNKKGGIDGHPVQIDVCDNQGNPDQSAVCGRKAKSNGDIAVVGSWDVYGASQILPVLQAEGIPFIGSQAATTAEVTNPVSFSFDPGPLMSSYAIAGLLRDQGCKNVVVFSPSNDPSSTREVAGMKAIAAKDGYKLQSVSLTIGQASVAAPVSTAMAQHPDCESYVGDGQTNVKVIAALRQQGYKGKIITAIGSLLPQLLKSLGKLGDGIITINMTINPDSTDPGVTAFRNQVTAYTGSESAAATNLNEFGQNAWSAVQLVDKTLTGTGSYTSAELLKKLPTMCNIDIGNYYPHLSFCKPVAKSTLYPHIFNDNWLSSVAKNGVYVPVSNQWHDYSSTIPAS